MLWGGKLCTLKTIKWANFKFSNIHGPRFPTRPISIILDRPQNLTPSHAWIGLQLKPKTKLKTGPSQNQTQIGPSLSPSPTRLHLLPHLRGRRRRRRNWIWKASPGALEAGPNCRRFAPRRRVVLLSPAPNTSSCSVTVLARSMAAAALAGARGLPLPADVDLMDKVAAMGLSKGTRRDGGAAFGLGGGRESMRAAPSGPSSIEEGEGRGWGKDKRGC